jgi:glycoside/pentoside/hexuronide:cation symporter, GPH family
VSPPQTAQPPAVSDQLKTREYLGYALRDTASNLFFLTFGIFLTYFYTDVWGLAPAAIGTMFLVIRLLDAATDPLIGLMADRTQTRWGKFRPYLLWFAVLKAIALWIYPLSQTRVNEIEKELAVHRAAVSAAKPA